MVTKKCLILAALAVATSPAFAGTLIGDSMSQQIEASWRPHRQETLELPGVHAGCGACETRPKLNEMAAPERCGVDQAGNANVAVFECAFSQECERLCLFVRCGIN